MNETNFYVTTPIYYVNDKPHIGHAYTTILADVLARYHRLTGRRAFFLTGTDEHGQKVSQAARAAGVTPQIQADDTVVRFLELWRKLEITNDDFIRTTERRHVDVVQAVLSELYERGEIYRDEYDGCYCTPCERFFTEKDLNDAKCPECGRDVEQIRESNYFFKMSAYQGWLIDYIETHPDFIQPDFRRNETLGFLKKPLQDLCISRPKKRLSWGIELPFDHDFVTYVWFDALINYVSAIGYKRDDEEFATWWPATYQLIGKDILTTHTVYWPTMLKAMGIAQPKCIFAHGWWLVGRDKMSKSRGNVVNPMAFAEQFGVDAFRYFLMAEMTLGQDASFTEEAFVRRYNVDLANDLGNILSRVRKLILSHFEGCVPVCGPLDPEDNALRDAALTAARAAVAYVENMRIDLAVAELGAVIREANRYLERRAPWTLCKAGHVNEAATVLYCAAETLRIVSGMLYPIMPGKMADLRLSLGLLQGEPESRTLTTWGVLQAGWNVQGQSVLFPRIRVDKQETAHGTADPIPKKPAAGTPEKMAVGVEKDGAVSVDDVQKLGLRIATILAAEKIDGADKLLLLRVALGDETRQVVAGIAQAYDPADLPGKHVVLVANLKPATIRGHESCGMLLAASDGESLRLLTVADDIPAGSVVR